MPSSTWRHWSHLTISSNSNPPTCLPPLPVSVVVNTYMRTPSLSRKLVFAKSEWNSDFQRVFLVSSSNSYLTKKDTSVCMLGLERGASVTIHIFLGPKKNPQLAVLSLAPPNLSTFLPFLSPPWVAPANQLPLLPSHQWGDLNHVLIEQPTVKMKVILQVPNSWKASPLPLCLFSPQ